MSLEFNKNIIEETINNMFFDKLYQSVVDYIMDLDSYDLSDYFIEDVEYADVGGISVNNLVKYSVNKVDSDYEIVGTLEVDVFLEGYIYWNNAIQYAKPTGVTIAVDFIYYQNDEGIKDFEITDFYM